MQLAISTLHDPSNAASMTIGGLTPDMMQYEVQRSALKWCCLKCLI